MNSLFSVLCHLGISDRLEQKHLLHQGHGSGGQMLKAWGEMAMTLEVHEALVTEEGMKFPDCNRGRREHLQINTQLIIQQHSMLSGDVPKLQYGHKKLTQFTEIAQVSEHTDSQKLLQPTLILTLTKLPEYLNVSF